jgi:hypothetical protein
VATVNALLLAVRRNLFAIVSLGAIYRMLCCTYPTSFAVPSKTSVLVLGSQDLPGKQSQQDAQDCSSETYPSAWFVMLAGSGRMAHSDS